MDNFGDRMLIIFLCVIFLLLLVVSFLNAYYFKEINLNADTQISDFTSQSLAIANVVLILFEFFCLFGLMYVLYEQYVDRSKIIELEKEKIKYDIKHETTVDVSNMAKEQTNTLVTNTKALITPKLNSFVDKINRANGEIKTATLHSLEKTKAMKVMSDKIDAMRQIENENSELLLKQKDKIEMDEQELARLSEVVNNSPSLKEDASIIYDVPLDEDFFRQNDNSVIDEVSIDNNESIDSKEPSVISEESFNQSEDQSVKNESPLDDTDLLPSPQFSTLSASDISFTPKTSPEIQPWQKDLDLQMKSGKSSESFLERIIGRRSK